MNCTIQKLTVNWNLQRFLIINKLQSRTIFWTTRVKPTERKTCLGNQTECKNTTPSIYQYNRNLYIEDKLKVCSTETDFKFEKVKSEDKLGTENRLACFDDNQKSRECEIICQEDSKMLCASESVTLGGPASTETVNIKKRRGIFRLAVVNWLPGQDCEERERILKVRSRPRSKYGYNFQYHISPYPSCDVPETLKLEGMWPSLDIDALKCKVGVRKNPFNDPCQKHKVMACADKGCDCKQDGCPKEETREDEKVCKTVLGPPPPKKKGPCFPPGGRRPRRISFAKILIPLLLLFVLGLVVICNCDDEECIDDEDVDRSKR